VHGSSLKIANSLRKQEQALCVISLRHQAALCSRIITDLVNPKLETSQGSVGLHTLAPPFVILVT
jgi:hypothetical protein